MADTIYKGLKTAANNPSIEEFRRIHGDMMLDGLLSKEYVFISNYNRLELTLKGVRCLLDNEGMKYD